jgi:hypothetical protein
MSADQSCLPAHAELPFGGSSILHRSASSASRKTRAGGVRRHPSGRNSRRERFRSINTPDLRACGYKTAPGRSNWPNRDPIGEKGGLPLYVFVNNCPTLRFDINGLLIDLICRLGCAPAIGLEVRQELQWRGWTEQHGDGTQNAFRHCLATCRSAKVCGLDLGRAFWQARERDDRPSSRMDRANNELGLRLSGQSDCWDACHRAAVHGELTCIHLSDPYGPFLGPCNPLELPE